MQVILAKNSGFCFGVRRAVDMALKCAEEQGCVYTLGEIIHNHAVVASLREENVFAVDTPDALKEGDTIVIRSHGVPPEAYEICRQRGLRVVDATCPFVKRIHEIVGRAARDGRAILIAGQPDHPEVIGIKGWAGQARVVSDLTDCDALPPLGRAAIVAQTTMQKELFCDMVTRLKEKCEDLKVFETICDTTVARQSEAEELAKKCNKMFVVGAAHSSNTKKLAQICKKHCKSTQFLENLDEFVLEKIETNDIIGIVAGASTPDWMIREVMTRMSELEKTTVETNTLDTQATEQETVQAPVAEQPAAPEAAVTEPAEPKAETAETSEAGESSFAEAFEKTLVRIRNGQIITGSVVQIVDGEVCVNIGYKSDGFIPRNEFSSDPDVNPADVVKVGDPIEVEVLKVNDGEGNVLLSRKSVEGKKYWEELVVQAEDPTKVFEAEGKEVVKGGLIATINGVRAFVPASHVSTKYVENLSDFVGKPMRLSVIEVDKARKRIVASQKNVLLAEAEAEKKAKWASLTVGDKVKGIVRRLADFGAFVDIGGIDGLVHVTDVAWGRVKHPSDVLKIGQEIEVLILNVDAEKERVSLGYKQLQPKPWTQAADKYPVGSIVEGKVVRIVPFGAFVALEPTIDGLIHISQVSERRIEKVEDALNVGDVVRCKVLDVNPEAKRISLSRKEVILEENPEIAEQIAAERAERNRIYAERQEQRAAERQAREQQQQQRRAERPAADQPRAPRAERPERSERRSREDADYELPPVQSATTSLADLFQKFNVEEKNTDGE